MSRRNRDLETRLNEWAQEYRSGRYENIGYATQNILQTLVDHKGFVPSARGFVPVVTRTAADEVEEAVHALDKQPEGYVPAMVLRCEYMCAQLPIEQRLGRMRRAGQALQRVRYYQLLRIGRIHVAAWLHLPFCDDEVEAA